MSGRTFSQQNAWTHVFRRLESGDTKKASKLAEGIAQQYEEFLNRYVATFTNDDGDFTFDATGTVVFNANVEINGNATISGDLTLDGGTFSTDDAGTRAEFADTEMSFMTEPTGNWYGLRLYTGDTDEFSPGVLGVSDSISTTDQGGVVLKAPTAKDSGDSSERDSPYILILGDATDGTPAKSINLIGGQVNINASGGSSLDVNGPVIANAYYFNDDSGDEAISISDGQTSGYHMDVDVNNVSHQVDVDWTDVSTAMSVYQNGGTVTMTKNCHWRRIGDYILVKFHFLCTSDSSGANTIEIRGLPVAVDSSTRWTGSVELYADLVGTFTYFMGHPTGGSSTTRFQIVTHAATSPAVIQLTNGARIDGFVLYKAA